MYTVNWEFKFYFYVPPPSPHLLLLPGKPVAVTHSRGKGASKTRPGTDPQYELAHWQNKWMSLNTTPATGSVTMGSGEDSNPDDSESAGSDTVLPSAEEVFHSMAEIASCSYEARKVYVQRCLWSEQFYVIVCIFAYQ